MSVSRRFLLRTAAASVALPALVSLPGRARAAAPLPPAFVFWYVPNGMRMGDWTPASTGAGYDLKPILAPLASVQSDVSVLTGLTNLPASVPVAGDHARGTGAFLTCRTPVHTSGSDISTGGPSIDQVIAATVGPGSALGSLEIGIDGGGTTGDCDSGYACAYLRNIAWAGPSTPLPKIVEPRRAFERLFAGTDPTLSAEDAARRLALRLSVLDAAVGDAAALRPKLSSGDRHKLDEYLDGVRALEERLGRSDALACEGVESPGTPVDFPDAVAAMNDITLVALRCDLTRVISFMLGNGGSNRSHGFVGAPGAHHEVSHHGNDPDHLAQLTKIGAWEVSAFADLVSLLGDEVDGDGNRLLDRCLVYFSSEISDGDAHSHVDLPVLLAGAGCGAHRPGRHLRFTGTPMANLFSAFHVAAGGADAPFGDDGTGALAGLA